MVKTVGLSVRVECGLISDKLRTFDAMST